MSKLKITLHTKTHELPLAKWDGEDFSNLNLDGLKCETEWVPLRNSKRCVEINKFTFPEFGEGRSYAETHGSKPFVAEIAGRRWKITLAMEYDNGHPMGGEVTFEETTAELSSFVPMQSPGWDSTKVFGQPKFIQGECFPHYNGKCASILAVIESGWGDCGNENLFLTLDENNLPCGLFHEASCC